MCFENPPHEIVVRETYTEGILRDATDAFRRA